MPPRPHDDALRAELDRKALEYLDDLSESLNWNAIAHLLDELLPGNSNLYKLAARHHTTIYICKALDTLAFQTRRELTAAVMERILAELRKRQAA